MSVRLPTAHFLVRTPGPAGLNAHRVPVPAGSDDRGPYAGHPAYTLGQERSDGRREQVGAWTVLVDPEAWPVTEADTLVQVDVDDVGQPTAETRLFRVHSAALLPGQSPALAYVTADCDVVETRPADA